MGSLEDHFQHLNILCLPKLHSFSVGKFMHWSLTSLPDTQLHNRTMPTGTQPQIWKFWWTKNCPTSTSKVPYKFCQVIALLLIPAKNPLTSFNKNTTGPTWPCAIPFPKRYHSTNILQSTQNTGCNLFLSPWLQGRPRRTETTTFERFHVNLCRWCQHFPPHQANRIS